MAPAVNSPRVGVVGLGAMGGPIAAHVVRAGFEVTGFDLRAEAVEAARLTGVRPAASAREVAESADLVITLLPSDAALDAVVASPDGLIAAARAGLIVAEASTLSLAAKDRARALLGDRGADVLDAPLSGTSHQARRGDLVVYASGDRGACDRAEAVFAAFSRESRYVGGFGAGSRTKLVANLLVAIHNVAAAEALGLGIRAGLDADALLDALTAGAGSSRMLEHRGPMMLRREYADASMTVDLFAKDLRLITALADEVGAPVPLLRAAEHLYDSAMDLGFGAYDTAVVFEMLERRAAGEPT
jgi:L-threonate 2-dehydrogenase